MCLAIPAQVKSIGNDQLASVDILGVTRQVALDLTPSANVGDYVLIHAGFAIEVVSEDDAQETLNLIKQFPELADVEGL
ncbi:MAG: HypC/HybG/HupF family hydrogenase formation chaperone [Eggerthellaceae bacterium]